MNVVGGKRGRTVRDEGRSCWKVDRVGGWVAEENIWT